jgi:hypothetical protein
MHERIALTDKYAKEYQKATKKEKGKILDTLCKTTGYNRKYAMHLLSNWGTIKLIRIDGKLIKLKAGNKGRKPYPDRKRIYDKEFQEALIEVWEFSDYLCGKRLKPFIKVVESFIRGNNNFTFNNSIWEKLNRISAASIDRILKPERKKYQIKGRSHTKPGTHLKHEIPIRTFADWDNTRPGFMEIDLVGHEGGNASGDFCFTLTATDIATEWTEVRAIRNKAQIWTVAALDEISQVLPFPMIGVDSDNGSEFINAHLLKYCKKNKITFTRSRPYHKNDGCFVEQKNDIVVRRTAGYLRYDTDEELGILNEMYESVRLWINFFNPSQKLISKVREGSKIKKKYDAHQTPYQRVMASDKIPEKYKSRLKEQFINSNPIKLKRLVDKKKEILQAMVSKKNQRQFQW